MKQRIRKKSIQHQFDAYCKKVIRNEAKNIRKRNSRIYENEKPLDYLNESEYQQNHFAEQDVYILYGMEILISDQRLSEMIDDLSEKKRKIVLLYYFAGFTDEEIAKILNMSTSGVWYQRNKAIKQMKMRDDIW